ncbi:MULTISPECIES: phage baseplate assembly protein [Achromobacter]|uniref:Phage baseplate assembly protein n=1 Tax=Achromobacter denitrificans TaxID=32002 RepID=A0A6N0JF70_ACHDE|nr:MULTISPECIES: hypothetical protein [Achromobacter]QKQ45719.1 hypothetical protein FOC81_02955 [Achromobacter denitrificans]CAB3886835.1 hypothetical protein LMG1860_04629 [Achromobacter denitrificans]
MAQAENLVTLVVGGQAYGGWKSIEIERGIEQLAGEFQLTLTHRWPGENAPIGLREGLPCEVKAGRDLLITGYIDTIDIDLEARSCRLEVSGRDKTGDLVDCSAIHGGGQWKNVPLEQIVRDICKPFGIEVLVETDTGGPIDSFALDDGEKAFDAIDRAARSKAVLVSSAPAGQLVLTRASETLIETQLVEGLNILRIRARHTWARRHSQILVKAQVAGNDNQFGATAAHIEGKAVDPEIDRYRPLIVHSEQGLSAAESQERAAWEVSTRMGRGKRAQISLVGWRTGKDGQVGELWRPNTLVRVTSPRMFLDLDLLITTCRYTLDEKNARRTTLTVCRPEAFDLEGASPRRRRKRHKHRQDDSPWDLSGTGRAQ